MKNDKLNLQPSDTGNIDDNTIRKAMESLPDGPDNPWFVQKVMNRLPAPNQKRHSTPVTIAYLIAAIILISLWTMTAINMLSPDTTVLTYADIIYICMLLAMTTILPISYQTC